MFRSSIGKSSKEFRIITGLPPARLLLLLLTLCSFCITTPFVDT